MLDFLTCDDRVQDLGWWDPLIVLCLATLTWRHPVGVLHLALWFALQSVLDLPCEGFLELLGELLENGDLVVRKVNNGADAESYVLISEGKDDAQSGKFEVSLGTYRSFSACQEDLQVVCHGLYDGAELGFFSQAGSLVN